MIKKITPWLFTLSILSGCSAVEWQHQHPSVSEGTKIALLNETNTKHNGIVNSVAGFCASEDRCPETMAQPVPKQYSTGEAVAKLFYTVTPYGMMTTPFADYDGRKIAVPPGRIGIVIKHVKTDEISQEDILNMNHGPTSTDVSWNCPNQGVRNTAVNKPTGKEETSAKFNFGIGNLMFKKFLDEDIYNTKRIYISKRNVYEWHRILWADLAAGRKYTVDLAKEMVTDDTEASVAGDNHGDVKVPETLQPVPEQYILSEPEQGIWSWKNAKFVVDENCMFSIISEQGDIVFGTKLATE